MDRFDRIFELNRIFQSARYPVSRKRLEEELECSRATVKRLIEEMRLYLNAPIKYNRALNGYYYDQREGEIYELPGLWFNASELLALLSMQELLANVQPGLLDGHLKPLRKRIDTLLGQEHAGEIARRIRILRIAARPAGQHFQTIAGAVANRKRLRLDYYKRGSDEVTERDVSPQRLVHYRDNWYLDAWCHLRRGLRTFALDAIRNARTLDETAKDVPEETLDKHYASAYGIFSGPARHTAVLRFTPERARWIANEHWHSDQQGEFLDDGRYELRIPYHDPRELIMDILKFGPDVEVAAPDSLRNAVKERLRAALGNY